MVLEPIEFMDGIYELNKFIKPCGNDMSRQVNQAFKLAQKLFIVKTLMIGWRNL